MRLSDERILSDLQQIVDAYHPRHISILDDNFMITPQNLTNFIKGYQERHFTFTWLAFARCDFIANLDPKILKQLADTNLIKICFGVESGSEKILKFVDKHLIPAQVVEATKKIAKYHIIGDYSFINGFPYETLEDINDSLMLRRKILSILPTSLIRFFVFTPLPGTEISSICERLNYVPPSDLESWAEYEYHTFSGPWLTRGYQRLVKRIAWASLIETVDTTGSTFIMKIALGILQFSSRLRLKYNFFNFSFELDAVDYLFRHKLLSV